MVRGPYGQSEAVFVDRSGRRRRLLTLTGAALGFALVTGLGVLAAGLMTTGSVTLPGWPDSGAQANHDAPAASVDPASGQTAPAGEGDQGAQVPADAQPTGTPTPTPSKPGQGDEHRRAPTRSPGKPG